MNVQFGSGLGYAAWNTAPSQPAPQPGASGGVAQPAQAAQPAPAQVPAAGQPYLMAYLSPAYHMAAPQMAYAGQGQPSAHAGASGPQGASASGGHVVSNATNGLAGASVGGGHQMAGYGGAAAMPVHGYPAFAMGPVMLLSPVFVQLGFPVMVGQSAPAAQQPSPQPPAPTDGVESPAPQTGNPVPAEPAPADDDDPGGAARPRLSIDDLNVEDFQRYRHKHVAASLETSLSLELETRDGDRVVLDFSQLDTAERSRFRGVDADGDRVRLRESSQHSERLVNMEVTGDLSDAEKTAIDAVLSDVIELAREFFGGSFEKAVERLNLLDFDTSTLLEASIEMNMTRSAEVTRGYAGGTEALNRLAERDGEIMKTLEFFADGQRRLVEAARDVLSDPAAVKMVRSLLPELMRSPAEMVREPLGSLVEKLAGHQGEAAPEEAIS